MGLFQRLAPGAAWVNRLCRADAAALSDNDDAAHRLTGVTDPKGNSITYTLDVMGNTTDDQNNKQPTKVGQPPPRREN